MKTTNQARLGDRLVIVACCKRGPVLVKESSRSTWQCRCGSHGADRGVVVLGALGEPWS